MHYFWVVLCWYYNVNYFTDDKYAAEVKEYDAKISNGISEKVKTPPPSPVECLENNKSK